MAITNAQQARQLYKNGGSMEDIGFSIVKPSKDGSRPGYRRSNYGDSGGNLSGGYTGGRAPERGDNEGGYSSYQATQQKIKEVENRRAAEDREKARIEQERLKKTEFEKKEKVRLDNIKKERERVEKKERRDKILGFAKKIPTPLKLAKKIFDPLLDPLTNIQRKKYIDTQLVPGTKEYTKFMEQLVDEDAATINVPDFQNLGYTTRNLSKVDFDDGSKFGFGEGYDNYRDTIDTRFDPDNTGGGGGDNYIPPTTVPKVVDTIDDTDEDTTTGGGSDMGGLAPRFMGSIFDFSGPQFAADGGIMRAGYMDGGMMEDTPEGGIMDLETGRQQYFLGKLVKKAVKAVKKVAKSPIGKAALIGGLGYLGATKMGGMKGLSSFFGKGSFNPLRAITTTLGQRGPVSSTGLSGLGKIFSNLGLADTSGALTGLGMIGVPTALSYLMTPKPEDDKFNVADAEGETIDYDYVRSRPFQFLSAANQGSRFNVADGGIMRNGYAEGSEEPVAKKTMPLLDMDGQEMDLREEGGFVPLGRMERADDVPARLSKNEFVFTADAVRNAGEGDIDKGAEVMYNMMKNLESGGEVSEESQGLEGARKMFQTSQRLEEVI